MRQDRPPRISTRRRAPRRIQNGPRLVDEHEIAAPTHRFYNERHFVEPAGGVPLFAVKLEHALQPWLANRTDACAAEVLPNQQTERALPFETPPGQLTKTLDACLLQVGRQQHVGASGLRRERLKRQAELV